MPGRCPFRSSVVDAPRPSSGALRTYRRCRSDRTGIVRSAAADPEGLELQERCSSLSGEYFAKEHGAGVSTNNYVDSDTQKILYDETHITFVNHYNVKEKRCLIVIASVAATRFDQIENTSTWIMLIDLNQHRTVGMFHQANRGPYADVCFIGPQSCQSQEEWDSLLKPYLRD